MSAQPTFSIRQRSKVLKKIARAVMSAMPVRRRLPIQEPLEARTLFATGFPAGAENSIAYDPQGNLHVAYYDADAHSLKYTRQSPGGTFTTAVTVDASSSDVGRQMSIAIDKQGRPGIAYRDVAKGDLKFARLENNAWRLWVVDSKGNVGVNPSLAFDTKSTPFISYYKPDGADLRLAELVKNKWKITTLVSKGNVGQQSSLAISPATGKPVVAYTNSTGQISYTQQAKNGSFNKPVTIDNTSNGNTALSVAFDSTGKAAFSYFDANTGQIKVASASKTDGKSFSVEAVTTVPGGTDPGATLLFDPTTNKPKVVYYDPNADGVFIASKSTSGSGGFDVNQVQQGGQGTIALIQPNNGSITFTTIDTSGGTPTLKINNTETTPPPPTGVAGAAVSDVSATITWTDASNNETGFQIERSTDGTTFTTAGQVSPNVTTFTDTGLTEGTTYYYRVSATGGDGNTSVGSAAPAVRVAGTPVVGAGMNSLAVVTTFAAAPTAMSATVVSATQINLTWADNSTHEAGYKLQRSDDGTTFVDLAVLAANATSYSDTTAVEGTTYRYRIAAYNAAGLSQFGGPVSATTPPAAPSNVTVSRVSTSRLDVSWSDNSHAETNFVVERSTNGTTYTAVATVDAGVTSYSNTGLSDATVYYYRVKAVGPGGSSAYSTAGNGTTDPNAPSNVTATPVSTSRIDIAWTDNATGETGYAVQRSTAGGPFVTVASVSPNATSYSDTGRSEGVIYTYRVKALAASGGADSAFSATVETAALPAAPTSLTATLTGSDFSQVALNWTDNSTGETGYKVERSADNGGTWTLLTTTAASASTYTDSSAAEGKAYSYRVRAVNAGGASVSSNTADVTTRPAAPTGMTLTAASTSAITIAWTDQSQGETGFKIERSIDGGTYTTLTTVGADVTAYNDTGLSAGATYYYRVRATNAGGDSASTTAASVATLANAPSSVIATAMSSSRIDLVWNPVTGATSYRIERSPDGTTFAQVGTSNVASYADTTVAEGRQYTYRVFALTSGGASAASSGASATTAPAGPTDFTATAAADVSVHLAWTDRSNGETAYEIERSADGGETFSPLISLSANTTSYSDATAAEATPYVYRVRAVNSGGGSTFATGTEVTTVPSRPDTVQATSGSDSVVHVTFHNTSGGATSFNIERSDDFGVSFSVVGTAEPGNTAFDDTTADPNAEYAYRVVAVGVGGSSQPSDSVGVTTPPDAVTGVSTVATSATSTVVSFTGVSGATGYSIERSTEGGPFAAIGTAPGNASGYADNSAVEGTHYTYRIVAQGEGGDAPVSEESTVVTPPATPTDLAYADLTEESATITWSDNSHAENTYIIEWSTDGGASFANSAVLGADTTEYDATVTEGDTFIFRVKALGLGGESDYSSPLTVPVPPGTPGALSASTDSFSAITLNWSDNSGHETGVQIERSSNGGATFSPVTTSAADAETFQDTGLAEATTYIYRIRSTMGSGRNSAYSDTVTVTTAPAAPDNVHAMIGSSGIDVTWTDHSAGETGFQIERSVAGGPFAALTTTDADETSFTDSNVTPGVTYSYRVRATNAAGNSLFSASADATTVSAVPQNLSASTTPSLAVELSWDDVDGETGYKIDRSDDNGTTWNLLNTTSAGITTYTDTTATELATYQYRVRSYNGSGESDNSGVANASTFLAQPTGMAVGTVTPSTVDLTWSDNSGSEAGYDVQRSTDGVNFTTIASLSGNAENYTDNTVVDGTAYSYRVIATSSQGNSDPSETVDTVTPLTAATGLGAASVSDSQIDLSWTDNAASESGYAIFRSTGGGAFVQIDTIAADSESFSDFTVSEGTSYTYKVTAVNAIATSSASNTATTSSRPAAPSDLETTADSETAITLSWTDHSNGETSFQILRSTDGTNFSALTTTSANVTTYQDTGLTEGTIYSYQVRAIGAGGASAASNTSARQTRLAAPSGLTATADSTTQISLSWTDNSAHTTGFYVQRKTGGGSFATVATVLANQTTYTNTGLTEGTTYQYQIIAYGTEAGSAASSAATITTRPAAAANVVATPVTSTSVTVTWDDISGGETGYRIERNDGGGYTTLGSVGANVTTYTDTTAAEATGYLYRVVSLGSGGNTNSIAGLALTYPAGPTSASASANSATSVTVTWNDNSNGETRYRIERSVGGGAFAALTNTAVNATSYTDNSVSAATSYAYRIYAVNATGDSQVSNTATVTTLTSAPTGVTASTASENSVGVVWNSVSGADHYLVQQSADNTTFSTVYTTPDAATLSRTVTGLNESTVYYFRVIAVNGTGNSAPSSSASSRTYPARATGLSATAINPTRIDLSWTNQSATATSIVVQRSTEGGPFTDLGSPLSASATSYSDTTAAGGTSYSYRLISDDGTAPSLASATASATTVPAAVTSLDAVASSDTEVTISWDASHGADTYKVSRSTDGVTFNLLATVSTSTYTDETATEATAYTYKVVPTGAADGPAATDTVTTLPAEAAGLTVTATTATSVSLSWTDVSAGESGYRLERSTDGVSFSTLTTTSADVTTYTDSTVSEATQYVYRLSALNAGGTPGASTEIDATTLPATPSAFTATPISAGQVDLAFTDNSTGETGYLIRRSSDGGNSFTTVTTLVPHSGTGSVSYSDTGVTGGVAYDYTVEAVGTGGHSPTVSASATTVPDAVTGLSASKVSATRVDLSWSDVTGETGYVIQRSVAAAGFTDYDTAAADAVSYSDTSVPEGTLVAYRVVPENGSGRGAVGDSVSTTTVPATPTGLSATPTTATNINLSWTDNSTQETGYTVEKSADGTIWTTLHTLGVDANSDSDTVAAGSTFIYRVYASGPGGDSAVSATATATTVPAAPASFAVSGSTDDSVSLSWQDVAGETGYRIERSDDGGSTWSTLDNALVAGTTSYTDSTTAEATPYSYRLTAFNGTGDGASTTTTVATPPAAPTSFVVSSVTPTSVTLGWSDNSFGETGYFLERSADAGSTWTTVDAAIASNTTTYTDSARSGGTAYVYRLKASNGAAMSTGVTVNALTTPAATSGITVNLPVNGHVELTWSDVTGETGWRVLRSDEGGAFNQLGSDLVADTTTFTDTTASFATEYVYRVVAFNGSGAGAQANQAVTSLPAAVGSLTATAISTTQVDLAWTDTQSHATSYEIYRAAGSDDPTLLTTVSNPADRTYSDTTAAAGTEYTYSIVAINAGGTGASTSATTVLTYPAAPTPVTVTAIDDTEIDVAWSNVDSGLGFRLYRSDDGGSFNQLGGGDLGSNSFNDTTVVPGVSYVYRVFAFNNTGDSAAANSSSVVAKAPVPASFAATPVSNNEVDLSWTDGAGETGYTIERADSGGNFVFLTSVAANANSYADTSVDGGTTYQYRIEADNASGHSSFATSSSVLTVPNPVQGVHATVVSDVRIDLTWNSANGATGYRIMQDSGSGFSQVAVVTSGTSYSDTGLTEGTDYLYQVVAYDTTGNAPASGTEGARTNPAAPGSLSASSITTSTFTLTFVDNSANEDNFQVQRFNADTNGWELVASPAAATGTGTGVTSAESSLTEGLEYQYRARAVQNGQVSDWSGTFNVAMAPDAPTALTATATSDTGVHLSFTDHSASEDGFRLERSADSGSTWTTVTMLDPNETSYDNTGLTEGTSYDFRVTAYNGSTDSTSAASASVTTLPAAPTGLAASAVGPTSVDLNWTDNSAGEDGFKIERSDDGGDTFSEIATVSAGVTTYNDGSAIESAENVYRVRSYTSSRNSAYASSASATTPLSPPNTLVASATSDSTTHLTWTDTSGVETGYIVQRKVSGGVTYGTIATLAANATSYDDTGLTEDTGYDYQVYAIDGEVQSTATGANVSMPLAAPTGLAASPASATSMTLTWSNHSTAADTVHIERSDGGAFAEVGTVSNSTATFTDTGLTEATQYTYRVYATKTGNASANSTTAVATTLPATPTTMAATVFSNTEVDLSWNDNSAHETGYVIERNVDAGGWSQLVVLGDDTTTYSDTGAVEGTNYQYRVFATGVGGNSANSNAPSAVTNPADPTGFSASPISATQVNLAWTDASNGETGYEIDRSTDSGNTWTTIASPAVNATSYSDTAATEGIVNQYRIRAVKDANHSGYATASATTVPAAPTSLTTATPAGSPRVTLSWTDNSSAETGYSIERSSDGGTTFSVLTTTAANATSYSDSTVTEGTSWVYRLRATGSGGNSDYTNTSTANLPPAAPSGLTVSSSAPTSVALTWTNNSATATGFRVERSTSGGTYVSVGTPTTNSFTDATVSENVNYQYRVKATTAGSTSTSSSTVSLTTPLKAPTDVAATVSGANVIITWTDVSTAETGYRIERSSDGGSTFTQVGTTSANVGTYTDTTAAGGTTYVYRVKATRSGNNSAYVSSNTITTVPTVPGSVSASASSDTSVVVSWTDSAGETAYTVERSTDAGSTWSVLSTTVAADSTSYTDSTTSENTAYVYRVRATNSAGNSAYATTASVTTLPAGPTGLTADATASDSIDLAWVDHSAGETGFKIERSTDGGSTWSQIATTSANVTSYSDVSVTESTGYTYRVRAYTGGRNSVYSSTSAATTLPVDPDSLAVGTVTTTSVALTWSANSTHDAGYQIERSTDGGDTFSVVTTTAAHASSYTDTGLTEGTEYQYRVRASNGAGGFSFYTATVTANTLAAAPGSLVATAPGATQVNLNWVDLSSGEQGYKIERRVAAGSFIQIDDIAPDSTSYIDTGVSSGTSYTYRIRAYNAGGDGPYSNTSNVTTP